jgi:hypothetical protein
MDCRLALAARKRQDVAVTFLREAAMRRQLWTLLMVTLLAAPLSEVPAGAAHADSLQDSTAEAERLAGEALTRIMRALNLLAGSVPQYAAPEVLPNGDIIIRRLNPQDSEDEPIETDGADSNKGVET